MVRKNCGDIVLQILNYTVWFHVETQSPLWSRLKIEPKNARPYFDVSKAGDMF